MTRIKGLREFYGSLCNCCKTFRHFCHRTGSSVEAKDGQKSGTNKIKPKNWADHVVVWAGRFGLRILVFWTSRKALGYFVSQKYHTRLSGRPAAIRSYIVHVHRCITTIATENRHFKFCIGCPHETHVEVDWQLTKWTSQWLCFCPQAAISLKPVLAWEAVRHSLHRQE
jgi:hypothetical protein